VFEPFDKNLRTGSASWSALLRLASVRSHEARRGVNGFGAFCRNKRASSAGAKPGTTEHHVGMRDGDTRARRSPANTVYWQPPRGILDTQDKAVRPEPCIRYDPLFSSSYPPFLSGIYLSLVSDGSRYHLAGDDDWYGFGLAHSSMSSDAICNLIWRFLQVRSRDNQPRFLFQPGIFGL
jgi:hypothetical protein